MRGPYIWISIIIWALQTTCVYSQFYSTGEPPASLHWKKINTPHFSIIFPDGIAEEANNLANKLEFYKSLTEEDLQYTVKRFPVVLHSTSVLSNGYVTLAPERMELLATPPQDGYAQDWISQLTLHEYRHAVQLGKLNQGFTHVISWLTGEIAPGVVSSLIPSWFYEGDAVYNETRLTETGRGRIPGFEMPLRTILMQQSGTFSYDKAVFGSYRDYVPDQYRYGYQLVNYARSRYGEEVWSHALDYTAKYPFVIWPLAFYLKKNYGIYKSGLYRQTMDSLKDQYNNQKESVTYIDYSQINSVQRRVFTSYILPKDAGNNLLLAMRKGLDDPGSFVTIDSSGRIKKLFTTGLTMGLKCDVRGDLLVWDEIRKDPRWGQRDFSVLQVYDLLSGEKKAFSNMTRYFSPDFSPRGNQIAVAETDTENKNYLTILNATTGAKELQLPAPQNKALQFPEWLSDTEIVVITVSNTGKQLEHINLKTNQWTVVLPNTRFDISEPTHYKHYILFRSSFNGIENIFAVSKNRAVPLYQVTFSRFGAYHPSVSRDSSSLLFSNYSHAGFDVVSIPLDTLTWHVIGSESFVTAGNQETAPGKQLLSDRRDQPAAVSYPVKSYGRLSKSLNLHSWIPFYADLEDFTGSLQEVPINLGVMAFSQNLLSTVISRIGYRYYEGNHEFIPVITWRGWYPVLEVSGNFGGPAREVLAKAYVPLSFTRGKYITQIQPQAEYEYTGTAYYVGDDLRRGIHYLHFKLFMNHYLRYSTRDLYPRWGQFMAASYTQTPADDDLFGTLLSFQAGAYFPGIAPHHHFYFRGGIQVQQTTHGLIPVNRITFPRGYHAAVSGEFTSLMLNYAFPVAYPDWALGPVLYLKRFRANLFHDWSYGSDITEVQDGIGVQYSGSYQSFGTEILADLHIIRIIFPVSAGVRLGYMPRKKEYFAELMLSVDTGVF